MVPLHPAAGMLEPRPVVVVRRVSWAAVRASGEKVPQLISVVQLLSVV